MSTLHKKNDDFAMHLGITFDLHRRAELTADRMQISTGESKALPYNFALCDKMPPWLKTCDLCQRAEAPLSYSRFARTIVRKSAPSKLRLIFRLAEELAVYTEERTHR